MIKSGLASQLIQGNTLYKFTNTTIAVLKNYGNSEMTVTHNGVAEKVPAYDAANDYVSEYQVPFDGHPSDFALKIEFAGKVGKAVLHYKRIEICP